MHGHFYLGIEYYLRCIQVLILHFFLENNKNTKLIFQARRSMSGFITADPKCHHNKNEFENLTCDWSILNQTLTNKNLKFAETALKVWYTTYYKSSLSCYHLNCFCHVIKNNCNHFWSLLD